MASVLTRSPSDAALIAQYSVHLFTGANVFFLPLFADSEIFEGFPAHIQEITPFAIHFSSVTTGMIRLVESLVLFKRVF
jgi:hypothetical protein